MNVQHRTSNVQRPIKAKIQYRALNRLFWFFLYDSYRTPCRPFFRVKNFISLFFTFNIRSAGQVPARLWRVERSMFDVHFILPVIVPFAYRQLPIASFLLSSNSSLQFSIFNLQFLNPKFLNPSIHFVNCLLSIADFLNIPPSLSRASPLRDFDHKGT